jgi:cytochrome c oxidase assembly protein subunit 15
VHACFAQAFFCLTAMMCVVTSRWWIEQNRGTRFQSVPVRYLLALTALGVVVIYLQLIAGATMRHYDAGLAIPDLPLAYGQVVPPTNAAELAEVNRYRVWELHTTPVSLVQIWLHFAHRIGAVFVTILIAILVGAIWRSFRHEPKLTRPAMILILLLVAQLTLGVLTVLKQKPADIASAHVAVGALLLVTAFTLLVRATRVCTFGRAMASRPADVRDLPAAMAVPA